MALGVLLIHGYTGRPEDFKGLPDFLVAACPGAEVRATSLPGHPGPAPEFRKDDFLKAIREGAEALGHRELVVIGHSMGGVLALAAIRELGLTPRLLVLIGTPKRLDSGYQARWNGHSEASQGIPFSSLAQMVLLANTMGARSTAPCPVLILHGEADELVPCGDALLWRAHFGAGSARAILVPGAGHHLFEGEGADLVFEVIGRAMQDLAGETSVEENAVLARLCAEEPEAGEFLRRSPTSARHLARCPSGCEREGLAARTSEAETEPVFANIEITTQCNLRCAFCARTVGDRPVADMSPETFRRILDLLPHAYRITLVGLGEPLMHPALPELVAEASGLGRRVALVTNALLLTREYSQRLIDAGLGSIAFSLDASTTELASKVRAGTDLGVALENIRTFNELAADRPISRAVFSAVSVSTLPYLEDLIRMVADLGVHVLMLTDLNFQRNLPQSLWKNQNDGTAASVRKALRTAFSLRLPVLSVRGVEAFALRHRYTKHLLSPPAQLYTRSSLHTYCDSPWQNLPVLVDGTVTVCDCQPDWIVGNLLRQPLRELWQRGALAAHRQAMISELPPEACALCPRF
jgi:MoaA/NifB/PqqE/SkfB family radical SAM enzyme/pimeloyl-ACP methyl ester carboxylesterase